MADRSRFCSDVSSENAEPLHATASRIDHWLLVEYRGVWSRDALAGSGLSDQVKARLRGQVEARPHSRLLFVRRPERRRSEGFAAFSATSREGEERLGRLDFSDYEDLRELDLVGDARPVEHPLFLVCTHGKHDPCCARRGRPLYEALRDELDEGWVWQCTHIGGDRFAGNLVCLPEGLYYGRVGRAEAIGILDEHLRGQIAPERYRGRSCYPFVIQAAELAVRVDAGLLGVHDLRFRSVNRAEGGWRVAFETIGGAAREARVRAELGDLTFLTCSATTVRRPRRYVATPGR